MKGDGDFLSLGSHGSSSKSHGSEGCSGDGEEVLRNVLSSLSRNGLSMLAGGSNSGFSLKAPPVGNLTSLRNLAMGGAASKVTGGGFTGFYRASANKSATASARPSLLKMRLETEVKNEDNSSCSRLAGKVVDSKDPLKTDVENLTPDECWRLILKLGSRWPAWTGTTTASSPAPPQGVMKDRGSTKDERVQCLQLGQDSLRLLATRALEALAQTPGRPAAGGMLAPKEMSKTKAAAPILKAATKQQPTLATVVQQPSLSAEVPVCSSREMATPKAVTSSESRTAPLTIFYAGTVNVCDNVPEDKARLIMLFAEKAGIPPNAQETAPSPSETLVRPQEEEELQLCSKPCSSSEVVLATTSSAHQAEASSSDQKPACSSPQEIAEPSSVPLKITISEGKSRQQRQQGTAKPLPNARKNSLARFLDSRKRNRSTTPCSEGHPTKRPALGCDGCPSDAEDVKGTGKSPMQLCSQSSIDSKEGDESNAEMLMN